MDEQWSRIQRNPCVLFGGCALSTVLGISEGAFHGFVIYVHNTGALSESFLIAISDIDLIAFVVDQKAAMRHFKAGMSPKTENRGIWH